MCIYILREKKYRKNERANEMQFTGSSLWWWWIKRERFFIFILLEWTLNWPNPTEWHEQNKTPIITNLFVFIVHFVIASFLILNSVASRLQNINSENHLMNVKIIGTFAIELIESSALCMITLIYIFSFFFFL